MIIGVYAMDYAAVASLMALPVCVAVIAWVMFREGNKLLSIHSKGWLSLLCSTLSIFAPLLHPPCFCLVSGAEFSYSFGAFGIIAAALSRTGYKYARGLRSRIIACLLGFIGCGLAVECAWEFLTRLKIVPAI